MDAQQKAKLMKSIQSYSSNKIALIAEESSSGRTLFKRLLSSFGFSNNNIHMAQDCSQIVEITEKFIPDYFVFSYELGKDKLIEFLNFHLEKKTSRLGSSFIVTSEDNSKSFTSMMLELEVVSFFQNHTQFNL